ncbi:MAG: DNRLRE domain-containing protein [Planctomycetes bacterium]|nr:DNRLRE domain-containing protein [Planctomycetota bacterium]
MNSVINLGSAALAAAFSLAPLAAQTTLTLNPDKDNTLYESLTGTLSNAQGYLFCGVNGQGAAQRTLLHFDVAAAVPAGAVIVSAELKLYVEQSPAFLPITTGVHRMSSDWGEATSVATGPGNGGGGAPATTGDATWLHSFYPTTFWTNAGGDFAATPTMTFPLASLFQATTGPNAALAADVQDMLDNPAGNFGWLLKTDEAFPATARRMDSRESLANKPALTIHYVLPGNTSIWGEGCPVGTSTATTMFVGPAISGSSVTIARFDTVQNSVGADFFALSLQPAGLPYQPGCSIYLPLGAELIPGAAFLSGTGTSTGSLQLPAGFPGVLIACQSAVLDNSPFGLSGSNAALLVMQ